MNKKYSIYDILSLIEQNFSFLHLGNFLSIYIKNKNLSNAAKNIEIKLDNNKFTLKGEKIKSCLEDSYINRNKPNILEYFVTWNAFRGIAMAVYEGIKNDNFRKFIVSILSKDKFKHFYYIIKFIRDVLSHNIDNEIKLINENFDKTKNEFLKKNSSGIADFEFIYSRDFPDVKNFLKDIPNNYGFKIQLNFNNLQDNSQQRYKFTDIISEWQLYMLMELCYNLSIYYRVKIKTP
ncbi:MAG TPA: hypothetical protein PLC43_03920 [Caldisericia bacterium]|nr:hypothetical protein [Caldisericia bacterium]